MHDNAIKQEKVYLVGLELPGQQSDFDSSMQELEGLAVTAGAKVLGVLTQSRERADGKTLLGSGKLQELKDLLQIDQVDTVIFNGRLTPRQNVNLEAALEVKVIDRMQLILDIFALRARSKEGMLQVELAQLKYLLPKLVGKGIALSRQAGGIGSRGPGESQLEMNRRYIHNRITLLETKLKKTVKTRALLRKKRQDTGVFKIGLIGYTNAGKSTLFNALTHKTQYAQDELFATLDATTKDFVLDGKFKVTLTDTVGFIQDLPTELVDAFRSTLEETSQVDFLIHVVDCSHPDYLRHMTVVEDQIERMEMAGIPMLTVYNKLDLNPDFTPLSSRGDQVSVSLRQPDDLTVLRQALIRSVTKYFEHFTITLPFAQSYQLPEIEQMSLIERVLELDDNYIIEGSIAPQSVWRLAAYDYR